MAQREAGSQSIRHYFVDESGDGVLFNRRGKVLVGTEGCSSTFILGLLDVRAPDTLSRAIKKLRSDLLADPYFRDVPSMQPGARKTTLAFHAKDDVPEVRREVFRLLLRHEVKFSAVIKRMRQVLEYVRSRNQRDPEYRYHPNELYDFTVRMLFKDRLHKDDEYRICFSRRGSSDRTKSLRDALEASRRRFQNQWGIESDAEIVVLPRHAHEEAGLQAVDYFLWALQRFCEKGEDRYIEFLWDKVSLVHDVDDNREADYGVYYTSKRPLTRAALSRPEGIG